ncbi:unnamed protein product [Microthlaspi erraticum]|uniref:Eukaryotic translation initiation factor 3 subunit B n=1 Tax=Microthlaspi erraticum TaxID=1685480 RepID=A0A6D2HMJ0_9BRAS|nr:unnamed protein product [Microthlaspi erraticum]
MCSFSLEEEEEEDKHLNLQFRDSKTESDLKPHLNEPKSPLLPPLTEIEQEELEKVPKFKARPLNKKVNLDSIKLPPGNDFGIESDDDDVAVYHDSQLEFDDDIDFGNIIVVDNLPVVPPLKLEKLEGVVRRLYNKLHVRELWMPLDPETNLTPGYCFIEFNTPQEAQTAKEKTHGYSLDKSHILAAYTLDEFERLTDVEEEEEWEAPQTKPYVPCENLQRWLLSQGDQLVVRYGTDTEVCLWDDAGKKTLEPVEKRGCWTESYVQWSPLGTYLVTLDKQGAALWGGADTFSRLMRYQHEMVNRVDFSPGEKYLVTYNYSPEQVEMKVFDVRSGRVMRGFKVCPNVFSIGGVCWARGDEYFAMHNVDTISVYETETFSLIDKKPIKVDNVVGMCWSPTDPIIALFVPGGGDRPGKVALVHIPSKVELRQKNLFGVSGCNMYWQSSGEYLAAKFDRYTYTSTKKKSRCFGFELFRIKEKDIPIEALELDNKNDEVIAFAWEPKGHRFAVIHGDQTRPDVSFYSMKTARVSKLATLKAKQANFLFWSPTGKYIVLAGLNGQLEFFNVDELETMATAEHLMARVIEWDPSGRYVATAVISLVHEMESGFTLWSFNGTLLCRILKDQFFQLAWRPRPPSLLSAEEEEEIAKNLKHYSRKFRTEDRDVSLLLREQVREKRKALQEEWEEWVMQWKSLHQEEKLTRQQLLDGEISDEEEEEIDGFGF